MFPWLRNNLDYNELLIVIYEDYMCNKENTGK